MEGQLSKFTNLVKGWQYRWFVLDPENGILYYYLDKEKIRNRGTLPLADAVVSPSEEDSMSFMISGYNGDIYKLRGTDAKERQHWINLIRAVAEFHGQTNVKPPQPSLPKQNTTSSVKRSATISTTTSPDVPRNLTLQKAKSFNYHGQCPVVQSLTSTNPIQEELKNIKDALNSVVEYQSSAVEALESGPQSDDVALMLDEQVLLLKATSQATVNILQQCYSIIQQQSVDLQGTAHARGLPPGATIEWFEPQNSRFERSTSTGSEDSVESAVDELPVEELVSISQYESSEVEDKHSYIDEQLEDMESHKSVILHLLSQLKLGMDLTRVVLPTFVLEKRSLLEMYADFMVHADLFVRIPDGKTAEDRILSILEFYLTSFHVGRKSDIAKKPYNPILGEHFHCSFDPSAIGTAHLLSKQHTSNGETMSDGHISTEEGLQRVYFVAEQVSHHPPISAFYAECPTKNICMNTHIWTKSKFYGMSIGVINVGEGIISLPEHNEEYIVTFPNAYCRSILTIPWIELGGRAFICCAKTGYNATITFHTKPFYGGKPNRVTCEVKDSAGNAGDSGHVICRGEGFWDGVMELNFPRRMPNKKIIDVSKLPHVRKQVRPLNMQAGFESRRLWHNISEALHSSNLEKATEEKHKLEENQRREAQQRLASSTEWKTKLFTKHAETWLFNHNLAHVQRRKKSRSVSSG